MGILRGEYSHQEWRYPVCGMEDQKAMRKARIALVYTRGLQALRVGYFRFAGSAAFNDWDNLDEAKEMYQRARLTPGKLPCSLFLGKPFPESKAFR